MVSIQVKMTLPGTGAGREGGGKLTESRSRGGDRCDQTWGRPGWRARRERRGGVQVWGPSSLFPRCRGWRRNRRWSHPPSGGLACLGSVGVHVKAEHVKPMKTTWQLFRTSRLSTRCTLALIFKKNSQKARFLRPICFSNDTFGLQ